LVIYFVYDKFIILADHTNGRAYATVLRLLSVVCTECIVAKWCVLEQKLLLTAVGSHV